MNNNAGQMISFYHTGFIICLIAAITLLVISVILFFVFDIRNVWLVRSGKAARKSIQEMSEASAKSGAFRAGGYQPRTKTSNLRQRKDNTGDIASGSGPTGENNHGRVSAIIKTPSQAFKTGEDVTGILPENEAVSVGTFKINKTILMINTDEVIREG